MLEFRCEDRRGTGRTSKLQLGHCDVQRDKELQTNRYMDFRGQTVFLHATNKFSWRGDFMPQKARSCCDLCASCFRTTDVPLNENWTFRSSLGVKRRIDFILCSSSFSLSSGCATNILDLNSDHRAVHAALEMAAGTRKKKRRRTSRWQPRCLSSYQAQLSEQLLRKVPESIHDLGHVMLKVAASVGQGHRGAGSSSQDP